MVLSHYVMQVSRQHGLPPVYLFGVEPVLDDILALLEFDMQGFDLHFRDTGATHRDDQLTDRGESSAATVTVRFRALAAGPIPLRTQSL